MIVWEYEVYDMLSNATAVSLLLGYIPESIKVYARKGEEGLLEDFFEEKKYAFLEPKEVEVDDDFNQFLVVVVDGIKEIDLAKDSGRLIFRKKPLEPSEN
jgi:hypothetical protein